MIAYLLVVLGVSVAALAAIVSVVAVRPHEDNTVLIATILGFATATAASILSLVQSLQNGVATGQVSLTLNSRLSEWRAETEKQREAVRQAAEQTVTLAAVAADKAVAAALAAADKAIAAAALAAAEAASRAYATGKAEGLGLAQTQQVKGDG